MNAPSPGATQQTAAGWFHDPYGRFEYRWHDGHAWTDTVAINGMQSVDRAGAMSAPPAPPAPPAPGLPAPTSPQYAPQVPALSQWQSQPGWQPQPGAPVAPSPKKSSNPLVMGLVAVVGVLLVGGAVVAIVSPSADEEQPAPEPTADTQPLTDAVAEFSTRFAWDEASPEDRANSCLAWELSPEFAREAFLSGAGAENEHLWEPMEAILRAEC